ncbi:MAG: glycosyl hydrolase 53 family protein [Bacteroidetes bacterium]|nr:glycosyl hydrolase 53 family protein [Bacteroidota bacterium]
MKHILFCSLLLFSCSKNNTPSPVTFSGVVSLNTNLSASEPLSNYTTEYHAVYSLGARGAQTAAPWGSLNPTGSTYNLSSISNPYFGLEALKTIGFESIFLNIPIVAINKRTMPADIINLPFDDPAVKDRFHALVDAIKDQLNDNVKYVALGNEVDTYFSTHPSEWPAYISLVEDARSYLRSIKPNIQVGVTTTFSGASVIAADQVKLLNTNMDVVALTYYPTGNNFMVNDPASVKDDVAKMIVLAAGKPVVVQEWGYPSSTVLGSSEQKQSDFLSNSFAQLKAQGSAHFPFVSFFKYRDWDAAYVQTITGQTAGQNFYEFMSSLGLKKYDGSIKASYSVLQSELKK